MSDQPQGPGWWQASDGRWYPPETHPHYGRPPPPVPVSPVPPARSGSACLPWVIGGLAVAVLGVVALAVLIVVVAGIDEGDTSGPGRDSGAAGAADEVDDVGGCTLLDPERLTFEVTNNSSKQSTYIIDVNFLDGDGQRVGDETFFVNFVRPDERVQEDHFVFDSAGGETCEVAEVQRFAAETNDDLAEVTCEITGLDPLGDIATAYTATNGSSGLSDYVITASLVRDGVRIGTSHAVIENVRPGQQAPGDGFSVTGGPAEGVVCEPVHVERTPSE